MNMNILTTAEMVPLSGSWLGPRRTTFLSIPKIAPYLEDVEVVHTQLLEVNQAVATDTALSRITEALAETDARHDNAIRAVQETLSGSIRFLRLQEPAREEEAARLERLLERLLPEGLSYVKRSYREEAGNAARMIEGLDAASRELLRSVPLCHGSVLDAVLLWGALGQRLGELENERATLAANAPAVMNERAVRSEWMRVVRQVLSGLELVKGRDEGVTALRQPVLEAVAAAVERAERRNAKPAGQTPPAAEASSSGGSGS